MWVFDGEEWTEEGGSSRKPDSALPKFDETMPELQVIEIEIEHVPSTPRTNYLPVPLP